MSGFTKLFSSIVHSTVWREADHVRLVWVTMLALADQDGLVEASVPGLADAARVSIEQCEQAITKLSAPDPYSRTPENEGRRIITVDGGWALLNHGKYREKSSYEDRKEKDAARQRKRRAKKVSRDPSRDVTLGHACHDIAEAEANADQPPESPPQDSGQGEPPREARPKRRKPKIPLPPSWTPNAAHQAKSATLGLNLDAEARKFRNNAEGKDVRWVDWDKAFHNWLENGATFAPRGSGGKAPGATEHDRVMAERDAALLTEIQAGIWGEQPKRIAAQRAIDPRKFREAIAAGKVQRVTVPIRHAEPVSGPRASSRPPPGPDVPTGSLAQLAANLGRSMP